MKEYKQIDVRAIDLEALGVQIAYVNTDSPERKEACRKNAHLIAAAEDLLEALQGYMSSVELLDAAMLDGVNVQGAISSFVGWNDVAKDAIAKARGES